MNSRLPSIAACAALVLAACASQPRNIPQVDEARNQLETAQADADAQRFSKQDIDRAQSLLGQAEALSKKGGKDNERQARHLAYLSAQTSRTAIAHGKARGAEERVTAAAAERDKIRLEARTAEAQEHAEEADLARSEAERQRTAAERAEQRAQVAEQRAVTLQQEMQQLQGEQSERGVVVTLGGDMLFDTGRSELKSGADRRLDTVANFLRRHPERRALVEGYTDSVGTEEFNRELSERRAAAVRQALVSRGIDTTRIDVAGYGEQYPVGTNADSGGRQLNRRVEIVLSTNDQPVMRR